MICGHSSTWTDIDRDVPGLKHLAQENIHCDISRAYSLILGVLVNLRNDI